jgi:anti-anti-sigma factor
MTGEQARQGKEAGEGLSAEVRSGCLWITLPDAINMDTHDQLEQGLGELLDEKPVRIVIDLSETRNMYSAGFGVIVRFKKRAAALGKDVCLVNVNPRVAEAITAVGLHKVLPVYEEGAALDFLKSA